MIHFDTRGEGAMTHFDALSDDYWAESRPCTCPSCGEVTRVHPSHLNGLYYSGFWHDTPPCPFCGDPLLTSSSSCPLPS